jgi:hypothetical protein
MKTYTESVVKQYRLLLFLALFFAAGWSFASPPIAIEFVQEQDAESEWILAKANCQSAEPPVRKALDAVVNYPQLHSWIRDTKLESPLIDGARQFLIEFKFPWPVGQQWSRVEVKKVGDSTISWHQLEGSVKMNRGRIVITERNQQAHLDYRANIDIGYPNTVTRHYKKKFVLEFLNAIYEEIQTPGDRAVLNRIH